MTTFVSILFSISLLLLLGMVYFYMSGFSAGAYPSKKNFHQRAAIMGGGGLILLLLTLIIFFLN